MKLFWKFCFMVLTSVAIAACSSNQRVDNTNNLIELLIDSSTNEGFTGDVHLSVIKRQNLDTATVYTLQALYESKPVGFEVVIPKNTTPRKDGFGEGIIIKTTGKNSDDFRNALAEIYKLTIDTNKKFVNEIAVSYVDLGQFIRGLGEKQAKDEAKYEKRMKLFFGFSNDEEAEVFLNINKEQKIIEFLEKDPEYRNLLIKYLTQE